MASPHTFLIVGLGNPGAEYELTRHNIGFLVLDFLASEADAVFAPARYGDIARIKVKNRQLVLLKPSTYMNLSGKAVRYWMETEGIPLERVLVVVDDLALPLGQLRLRGKGSHGSHNGLRSIEEVLSNQNYSRLRFGIGSEFSKGGQVNFVLGQWKDSEWSVVQEQIPKAAEAVRTFALAGLTTAMNQFNQG